MRRFVAIALFLVIAGIIGLAIILYPKFANMKSEYATANAAKALATFVKTNSGAWPKSAEELAGTGGAGGFYPDEYLVFIDYSVSPEELIADPEKLNEVVRPISGKFYTYPHHKENLRELLIALRESNPELAEPE